MALHGEIMVNHRRIGSWCANRTSGGGEEASLNEYSWWVQTARGRVAGHGLEHRYGDGAAVLIFKVFAAAYRLGYKP